MLHSKQWPGAATANAYESLSTQAPGRAAANSGEASLPKEAAQWQCGQQRLALRERFNMKEIDTAKIMAKYDLDKSKVLEPSELRQLLTDFAKGVTLREDDLEFVLRVADKDRDECISQEELHFALKAWFAFNQMPKSVGAVFGKLRVGDGPMPTVEVLLELLLALNDAQPVEREEAVFVRQLALSLGATEEWVSLKQMRQAVATWYLHVERGETSRFALLKHAAHETHERIVGRLGVHQLLNGRINFKAKGTHIVMGLMAGLFILVPALEFMVASVSPSTQTCEHPHLSHLLWATGLLTFLLGAATMCGCVASCRHGERCKIVTWTCACTVAAMVLGLDVVGVSEIMTSTAGKCGFTLWHFGHFVYIQLPILVLVFLCLGLPGLYCVLGSAEFFKSQELDQSLMKV